MKDYSIQPDPLYTSKSNVEDKPMLEFSFYYKDEFGQKFLLEKSLDLIVLDDSSALEVALQEFKLFLLSLGHSPENVEKIMIVE